MAINGFFLFVLDIISYTEDGRMVGMDEYTGRWHSRVPQKVNFLKLRDNYFLCIPAPPSVVMSPSTPREKLI